MADINKWQAGALINNQYKIESFIGKGGMGKTYIALDTKSRKKVALKLLCFSDIEDWKVLELFEREIKTLSGLDHPLIPDYLDNFKIEEGNDIYYVLVQEYIQGKNLLDLIKNGKRFTNTEVENIFRSLLETILYIHSLRPPVIHRDINPKNIILSDDNTVYLVDFGAVADPGKKNATSTIVGTIGYMPQEQLYGKVKPASDMYALAATIVFLLTGREPSEFELKNMRLDYHGLVDISNRLQSVLDRMLNPDYNRRLSDAKKAIDFLEGKGTLQTNEFEGEPHGTDRIIINQTDEGDKEIRFKKNKFMFIFLLFFAIAWNSFLFGPISSFGGDSGTPFFIYLFMLPFFAAGIFMIGAVLYGFFGKIKLVCKNGEFHYSNMIFNFTFKKTTIPYHQVNGMKITDERGSKGSVSHVLTIFGPGRTIRVGKLQGLGRADLEYLKDVLEREAAL